jgi:hypothetical protein
VVVSFVNYESKYPWADREWALKEAAKFGFFGNLFRSTMDYWLLWKDRDAYIEKHYTAKQIEEMSRND